jgi:phospholipase/carboxylesterase
MNRTEPASPALIPDEPESIYEVEASRVTIASGDANYNLFSPLHYEKNYGYPLVVWLHGAGGDERQLKRIMPHVSMRNYVAVSPRGTTPIETQSGREAFTWRQSASAIAQAEDRVMECIELAQQRFNIHPGRIFIAGMAEGGTMAIRLGLNYPELFAGVLSLVGAFPHNDRPLRNLNQVRRMPMMLAVGNESEAYPEDRVCQDLRLFHSAGLQISIRQYPVGDELTTLMLADMDRWIMEQFCPSEAACSREA